MAIVQISRIQHRSGLAENLPQLAKAELGWVVDAQKLYIGNGQLSDYAPAVGNTEILTEHSDILNLASTYTFKNSDAGYVPQTGNARSQFNSLAWDNITNYVAVGNKGLILHSVDGASWINVASPTSNNLLGVAYGNGIFVAVGANGTIIYSSTGTSWQNSGAVAYTAINGITYGNGLFVIVTLLGTIYTSNNGINWTLQSSGVTNPLYCVTYANSTFMAGGSNGIIVKSTDGQAQTWTNTTISQKTILNINYMNSNFVATTSGNKGFYSPDGVTWYRTLIDSYTSSTPVTNLSFTGVYAITSWGDVYRGTNGTLNYFSTVEIGNPISLTGIENFTCIYYANSTFIVLTGSGRIFTSTLAGGSASWTEQTSITWLNGAKGLNSVYYDGTTWVIAGDGGVILTSTDAISFTQRSGGTANLGSVTANFLDISKTNTTWVAVGTGGTIYRSTSPTGTWTISYSGVTQDLRSLTVANLGGGTYKIVAVGRNGVGVTSGDGITWTTTINSVATDPSNNTVTVYDLNKVYAYQPSGIVNTYSGGTTYNIGDLVSYNGNLYRAIVQTVGNLPTNGAYWKLATIYIAVGDRGQILTSLDTVSWYTKLVYTNADYQTFAYNNNYFYACGDIGLTYSSSLDSNSWNTNSNLYGPNLTAPDIRGVITNGTNHNLMIGQYGFVYDAHSQVKYWHNTGVTLLSDANYIIYTTQFLSCGNQGLIANSTDGLNWTNQSYSYGSTQTVRSLQQKLDDFVSVKDFGARGDGVTDDTEAINRALYEVYCRNLNPSARKVLYFPGGNYIVYGSINVPSHANIVGEGTYNTTITQTLSPYVYPYINWVMQSADSLQQTGTLIGLNNAALPTDINISNLTINSLGSGFLLNSATTVNITKVRFNGPFSSVTTTVDPTNNTTISGIQISGYNLVPPSDVNIVDCIFTGFNYGIYLVPNQYLVNSLVDSCSFKNLYNGVVLNGASASNFTLSNSIMDSIYAEGIKTTNTTNFLSFANYYKDVGNNLLGYSNPKTNVILYDNSCSGCATIGDGFDRTDTYNLTFHRVSETQNNVDWNFNNGLRLGAFQQMMGKSLAIVPNSTGELGTGFDELIVANNNNGLEILYTIQRNSQLRTGRLTINLLGGNVYIDDDSSQTADVGVTFGFDGVDLTYTADGSTLTNGLLNYSIRYLEML